MYTAILPIKDSKVLKVLSLNGIHLFEKKIQILDGIESISEIIVSTNSEFILSYLHKRPDIKVYFRDEKKEENFADVVSKSTELASKERIIWTFITTPFNDKKAIEESIKEYEDLDLEVYDSLVTCKKLDKYIFDDNGPINFYQGDKHKPTKDLSKIYEVVNKVFIMEKKLVLKYRYPWGKVPYKHILDKYSSFEVKRLDDIKFLEGVKDD